MTHFVGIVTAVGLLFSVGAAAAENRMPPQSCTYEVQSWNVTLKQSVDRKTISHPYSSMTSDEIDPLTGCTVCSEDQEMISIPPLEPFLLCSRIAPQVRGAIQGLIRDGAPVFAVIGYHVIRSRGPVDSAGNRTGFSNHSFGSAIDINPGQNGLYDHCLQFGPRCRLVRGGEWRPGVAGTLERDNDIVKAFKTIGLRWGGEIRGRQKDFMHFSPTGY